MRDLGFSQAKIGELLLRNQNFQHLAAQIGS
jgi:hypothetical protein